MRSMICRKFDSQWITHVFDIHRKAKEQTSRASNTFAESIGLFENNTSILDALRSALHVISFLHVLSKHAIDHNFVPFSTTREKYVDSFREVIDLFNKLMAHNNISNVQIGICDHGSYSTVKVGDFSPLGLRTVSACMEYSGNNLCNDRSFKDSSLQFQNIFWIRSRLHVQTIWAQLLSSETWSV